MIGWWQDGIQSYKVLHHSNKYPRFSYAMFTQARGYLEPFRGVKIVQVLLNYSGLLGQLCNYQATKPLRNYTHLVVATMRSDVGGNITWQWRSSPGTHLYIELITRYSLVRRALRQVVTVQRPRKFQTCSKLFQLLRNHTRDCHALREVAASHRLVEMINNFHSRPAIKPFPRQARKTPRARCKRSIRVIARAPRDKR